MKEFFKVAGLIPSRKIWEMKCCFYLLFLLNAKENCTIGNKIIAKLKYNFKIASLIFIEALSHIPVFLSVLKNLYHVL